MTDTALYNPTETIEHIKESAQRSGRYDKRAREVAARTVMKQHKEEGTR